MGLKETVREGLKKGEERCYWKLEMGLPWWSSAKTPGSQSVQGAWAPSLVGELDPICHKGKILHAATKIKDPECRNYDLARPNKCCGAGRVVEKDPCYTETGSLMYCHLW